MCVRLFANDLKLLHHFGSTMNSIYLHSQSGFEMTQKTEILECWNQSLQIICNLWYEELEDTKGAIRIRISKNRQHN